MVECEQMLNECLRMRVGHRLEIYSRDLSRAFPCGWPSTYRTTREALLSALPGTAWGTYTVTKNLFKLTHVIERHEESDRRVYIDPDREH